MNRGGVFERCVNQAAVICLQKMRPDSLFEIKYQLFLEFDRH